MLPKQSRKLNESWELASWFITQYLKREIGAGDNKGQHLANAKALLKEFPMADIKGCLLAARDGWLGLDVPTSRLTSLPCIKWLEPPLIQRWFALKQTPPPVYLIESRRQWSALTGLELPVFEASNTVLLPLGGVYVLPE